MVINPYESTKHLLRSPLVWLSVAAALFYSSWPWSFWLDPVVAHHALASELEAVHRPYNWLFILMDVMTGLVLAGIGGWQLRKRLHTHRGIILGYILFGLLVAVAALTPLVCDPTSQSCGPLLHNYRILIHGAASIWSVVFLFLALVAIAVQAYQRNGLGPSVVALGLLLFGWVFFGVGSVAEAFWHIRTGNLMQDFFISLCSLSIVAVVATIEYHHVTDAKPVA